ncbi:MAG: hypothetical protein H7Z17_15645, partial [Fuerstia sp.]|nr:hypothetical protein [Fuerstiella sp.]
SGGDAPLAVVAAPPVAANPDRGQEIAALETERNSVSSDVLRLQQQVSELEQSVAQQETSVAGLREQNAALEGKLQAAEASPDNSGIVGLQNRISRLRSQQVVLWQRLDEQEKHLLAKQLQLKAVTEATAAAKAKLYAVNSSIVALRKQVQDAQKTSASAGTETILEFTNTVGTTRTPIIVEVTRDGYKIQPTGIMIQSKDMEGFPVSDTPLLAAILAVHRERAKGSVTSQPYVLLLVRPSGSEAFYPAQGILANEKIHFGYELIEADKTIATGESAPGEIAAAEAAMAEAFRRREKIYANLRYIAQGISPQGAEAPPDPSQRGLTIRPDGTVRSAPRVPDPRATGRNFAGGVAPPPGFYERRAAALAAEAVAREKSRHGSGTSEPAAEDFEDQFAQHYAQSAEADSAEQVGGGFSQMPASRGPQSLVQNSAPATGDNLPTAEPVLGSNERAEQMLFANEGQPLVPKSASTASKGSGGSPPLTAEEEFAAMMSGTPSTEPPSAAPRHFQMPSASGTAGAQSQNGEPADEVPGSPMLDLSRVDKDLLNRLPSTKKTSKAWATPVGITVFLDEHHMTVGQQPAIPVTPDSLTSALSDLLRNIDTEVSDARKTPREEVMPIVKFIVSPGGERWRIPLSGSLKHLGIPSATVYELSPYIQTTAAPGRASF